MNKVLIVVDVQNDFVDGVLGTPEAIAIVDNVINKIKQYSRPMNFIYATQDTHSESYLQTPEGTGLPIKHCVARTHGWMIKDKVLASLRDCSGYCHTYYKQTFGSDDLVADLLREHQRMPFDSIELVGLCTDICVLTNAIMFKQAFAKEFVDIIVDASCCAGSTPEKHKAALNVMKSCQIQVINED